MFVNLLDYTSGKRKVMAIVRMNGDSMQIEGQIPPGVLRELEAAKKRASTPERFLKSLPTVFSGSYLRAQFDAEAPAKKVEEPPKKRTVKIRDIKRDERGLITQVIEREAEE